MEEAQVPRKVPKKPDPEDGLLNIPPEMFNSVFVTRSIPPMEYRKPGLGVLFENFLENWELKQIERNFERRANIEEHNCRLVKAQIETLSEIVTFGQQVQAKVKRLEHETIMTRLEEEKAWAEVDSIRMKNLVDKAEYDRLLAETRAITFQLENKNVVDSKDRQDE